jgi:hypothetical protein
MSTIRYTATFTSWPSTVQGILHLVMPRPFIITIYQDYTQADGTTWKTRDGDPDPDSDPIPIAPP